MKDYNRECPFPLLPNIQQFSSILDVICVLFFYLTLCWPQYTVLGLTTKLNTPCNNDNITQEQFLQTRRPIWRILHSNFVLKDGVLCKKLAFLIFFCSFPAKLKIKVSPWCEFEIINKQSLVIKYKHMNIWCKDLILRF